jgi:hypothetical protein
MLGVIGLSEGDHFLYLYQMRGISEEQAKHSWNQLLSLPAEPGHSRAGLKALDRLFFDYRIRTKTKMGVSFAEALVTPDIMEHLTDLVVRYKRKPSQESIYQVFCLWYGSVNQFRPAIAKWIISRYAPKVGLLDFSAGWGGRALASMSLNVPYTGVDTNTNLQESYRQLQEYNPTSPLKMIWEPAEEASFDFPYDMVLTSPPYWTLERYEEMPTYKTKREFFDRFLTPVILKAWTGLLPGGHMCLNMPVTFYEEVKDKLPPLLETLEMPLANRRVGRGAKAGELVYVWRKV